jgi:hypothetical protein
MNVDRILGPLTNDDMRELLPELMEMMQDTDVLAAVKEWMLKHDLVGELDADAFEEG